MSLTPFLLRYAAGGRVFLFVDTCHLIRFMIQLKSIPQFIAFVSQDKVYTRDLFRRD